MRAVVQRVRSASVLSDGVLTGAIEQGLVVLLGVERGDTMEEMRWLASKVVGQRIFNDTDGKMNIDLAAVAGQLLVVSQFTLLASTRKGQRPSYVRSALPPEAEPLYEAFVRELARLSETKVATGRFGADMQLSLVNDGPVTIVLDTRLRE